MSTFMAAAAWFFVASLVACSGPQTEQQPSSDGVTSSRVALSASSTPSASSATEASALPPAIAPSGGPTALSSSGDHRARDLAVETWGEPHDLTSHLRFLRSFDPETDARCRNAELLGATVAEQVERFVPGEGVERSLGCSGSRCHIRIAAIGGRRVVGLEIFYTRHGDRATEVECYPIRGG